MVGIEDDKVIHNEERIGRNIRVDKDEDNLFELLKHFNEFSSSEGEKDLKNIAAKDLATESIRESLFECEQSWAGTTRKILPRSDLSKVQIMIARKCS